MQGLVGISKVLERLEVTYATWYGSKPKTRIQLREMRADSHTCALLGKKAAPGWTTAPKACRRGGSVMQLETKRLFFHAKQVKSSLRLMKYFASGTIPKHAASAWFADIDNCMLHKRSRLTIIRSPRKRGRQPKRKSHLSPYIDSHYDTSFHPE